MTKNELIDILAREIGESKGCRYWKDDYPDALKEIAEKACEDVARAYVACNLWCAKNKPEVSDG